jgi:DNA replication protein DnaC
MYGSGKTYLAAAVITKARTRHRTLFAFVSHAHQQIATAKSILLSLLFQLASDDPDVQSVLARANDRDLSGNTKHNLELLRNLLDISPDKPTYLILDGLDEIEAGERSILLQYLVNLLDCSKLKILISSRPEDDIVNVLENKAVVIRVDQRNSDSIRSYVDQRSEKWVCDRGLDDSTRKEVHPLLTRLAAKSDGKEFLE